MQELDYISNGQVGYRYRQKENFRELAINRFVAWRQEAKFGLGIIA
jgi:hypothetical protein